MQIAVAVEGRKRTSCHSQQHWFREQGSAALTMTTAETEMAPQSRWSMHGVVDALAVRCCCRY
jgi:hypothetical protein